MQVHQRLKLALLEADVPQTEAEKRRLAGYDMRLWAEFRPGVFALEPFLQPIAPASQYWWLYGSHQAAT
ncbi:MAG: hypothetical protein KIH69_007080 [Anaerolineae bacterium]|nr:hypothetical protein [Anaerolineae bacterium]